MKNLHEATGDLCKAVGKKQKYAFSIFLDLQLELTK